MHWRQADFLAGLFVITGAALIVAIILVVRGQINNPDRYHTYFSNVGGLRTGAAVVYEGYIIGSVAAVSPVRGDSGMRFRINLDVEQGWIIPADSVAEISPVSLLSANAVQISAGNAKPLAPGDEIQSIPAANVIVEISKTADELTEIANTHLAPLLTTLRDVLDSEGRGALGGITQLSRALAEYSPKIMSNLDLVTENLASISDLKNADAIQRTIANVEQASQEVVLITDAAADVASGVSRFTSDTNMARIDTILGRLDGAAMELETIMKASARATLRMEDVVSEKNINQFNSILDQMHILQRGVGEIINTSKSTAENVQIISEISEDRLAGFLQRMEVAAMNIEEMTARLRDDPSLLIRTSE